MLFSTKETIEDRILRLLIKDPLEIKDIHSRLFKAGQLSLRAVYKAVNALIDEGVLLKAGKRVFVDQEWMRRVREQLLPALPSLTAGERVVYTFASIEH